MANFSYADYQNVVAQAQANGEGGAKVGYFKLKNDGDIAIARLNIGSTDELMFASVHTIGINGKWIKVRATYVPYGATEAVTEVLCCKAEYVSTVPGGSNNNEVTAPPLG